MLVWMLVCFVIAWYLCLFLLCDCVFGLDLFWVVYACVLRFGLGVLPIRLLVGWEFFSDLLLTYCLCFGCLVGFDYVSWIML